MLKKYSILTLLFIAYTLVLAHSIVPHHHHNDEHQTPQSINHHDHGAGHHHSGDDDDDGSLAHEFENYIHASGNDDIYQQSDFGIDHNTIATVYILASFEFNLKPIEDPPSVLLHLKDYIPIHRHCLFSKGLRAPPSTLI